MGPLGLTFYTICYIANSLFGVLPRAHYQLQIRPNLAFINWFVKLNGNSVLIPGIYLGEIKGKNLARLAHFFVVEYFYQDPLAQENQQPLQYMCHDIKEIVLL